MRQQHFGQVVAKAITGDRAVCRARGAAKRVTDVGDLVVTEVGGVATGVRGAVVGTVDVRIVVVAIARDDLAEVFGVADVGGRGISVARTGVRTINVASLGAEHAGVVVVAGECAGAIFVPEDVAEGICGVPVAGPSICEQLAVAGEGSISATTVVANVNGGVVTAGAVVGVTVKAAGAGERAVRRIGVRVDVVADVVGGVPVVAGGGGERSRGRNAANVSVSVGLWKHRKNLKKSDFFPMCGR